MNRTMIAATVTGAVLFGVAGAAVACGTVAAIERNNPEHQIISAGSKTEYINTGSSVKTVTASNRTEKSKVSTDSSGTQYLAQE